MNYTHLYKLFFLILIIFSLTNCTQEHRCHFVNKSTDDSYLKSEASCTAAAEYYYSCSCGKMGFDTFTDGDLLEHDFSRMVANAAFLKEEATCTSLPEYYYSCSCKKAGTETFTVGAYAEHNYSKEIVSERYLKSEATFYSPALYYKSCVCGMYGNSVFMYGDILLNENSDYMPRSLTISFYDISDLTYGFTYNTSKEPGEPVVMVQKQGDENSEWKSYPCTVTEASSYITSSTKMTYYVCKAEIKLEANTTYSYRILDNVHQVGTKIATLKTNDPTEETFKFAHVSDSQVNGVDSEVTGAGTGVAFGNTLSGVLQGNSDFIIQSGDVVEWSKY